VKRGRFIVMPAGAHSGSKVAAFPDDTSGCALFYAT